MLSQGDTLQRSPRQVSVEVRGETVILGLDAGVYFGLEGVGARIWQMLEVPRKVSEITKLILEEYAVTSEQFEADLRELVEELAGRGLLIVSP